MAKQDKKAISERFKKVKTDKEKRPTPVIQEVKKPRKNSPKKEGVDYVRLNISVEEETYIELNMLKILSKKTQMEIVEEALKAYLPKLRADLEK